MESWWSGVELRACCCSVERSTASGSRLEAPAYTVLGLFSFPQAQGRHKHMLLRCAIDYAFCMMGVPIWNLGKMLLENASRLETHFSTWMFWG